LVISKSHDREITRSRNFIAQPGVVRRKGTQRLEAVEQGTMIPQISKDTTRQRVHSRIRKKLQGSEQRPRLNVYRSLNHIYAQLIDDEKGVTIAAASTTIGSKEAKGKGSKKKTGGNLASAKEIGKQIAQRAQEKGVKQVVFDRGGYLYHGRIKALADAAREAGLEF
jgi:large subunit ribosomal protein L18